MTDYHDYLLTKSAFGDFYRRHLLFPWLNSKLQNIPTLDVGTGLGDFLDFLPSGSQGVDINLRNVEYARSLGRQVSASSDTLPFSDDSWPQIICDQVLEHLKDPHLFILEIKRVLSTHGHLMIGVPCKAGFKRDKDHQVFYNKKSLTILMSSYNFKLESSFYYPVPYSFIGGVLRLQSLYLTFSSF